MQTPIEIVKSKPILFSGPMIRAILAGQKTVTRRIIKGAKGDFCDFNGLGNPVFTEDEKTYQEIKCPYEVGMRLWVRETWRDHNPGGCEPFQELVEYRATPWDDAQITAVEGDAEKWKPSIFMPRWASRITLEIVSIRVERLNDISEEDAKAECVDINGPVGNIRVCQQMGMARYQFANLWESINGPGSWEKSPWVWVVEFRRIDA